MFFAPALTEATRAVKYFITNEGITNKRRLFLYVVIDIQAFDWKSNRFSVKLSSFCPS